MPNGRGPLASPQFVFRASKDVPNGADGSWSSEGTILLDGRGNDPILRIPAAGGSAKPEVAADATHSVGWPQFLPDGRHFLYMAGGAGLEDSQLMVRVLDATESKPLMKVGSRV